MSICRPYGAHVHNVFQLQGLRSAPPPAYNLASPYGLMNLLFGEQHTNHLMSAMMSPLVFYICLGYFDQLSERKLKIFTFFWKSVRFSQKECNNPNSLQK